MTKYSGLLVTLPDTNKDWLLDW